jgi:hypothetical protein
MNVSPLGITLGDPQRDFKGWAVIASRFPRKLWVRETSSASSRPAAVFSAVP